MIEITDTLKDLNPEDRVFKLDDVLVKVKTLHDDTHSQIGQEIYRLSGSICDAKGKALPDGRGGLHVHQLGHTCTIQGASDMDLIEALQPSTETVIRETVQAYKNWKTRRDGKGVGSLAAFQQRLSNHKG